MISCNAQTPKTKKMTPELSDKEIRELGLQIKKEDTLFMKDGKLDIERLEKEGTSNGASVPTDDSPKYTTAYHYERTNEDDVFIKIGGNNLSGYSKTLRKKDSLFETFYGYYTSGNIKVTGNSYINRFSSGIRFYYNEKGNIEKYEDYDAPYKFTWEDVLVFLKEQKIKEVEITNIYRGALDGIHGWEIIYKPKEFLKTENVKVLTLDAKTGAILTTEVRNMSRELD